MPNPVIFRLTTSSDVIWQVGKPWPKIKPQGPGGTDVPEDQVDCIIGSIFKISENNDDTWIYIIFGAPKPGGNFATQKVPVGATGKMSADQVFLEESMQDLETMAAYQQQLMEESMMEDEEESEPVAATANDAAPPITSFFPNGGAVSATQTAAAP